jgi:formyltetrahydrofolate deformylase
MTAVLKITCRDQQGLIAGLTSFIYHNLGNIVTLDEYVDPETKLFFMRLEWEMQGFLIERQNLPAAFRDYFAKKGLNAQWEIFFGDTKPRLGIFVSKYDHCLYDLLLRHKAGELRCEIPLVLSNHRDLQYVADAFGIDFKYVPVTQENRLKAEEKQLALLENYKIDFIVLARYMQILSNGFINNHKNKIINVHHSFLPAFKGAKAYQQAYARGVKVIGSTSHFVNEELDQGPIIQQDVVHITHKDKIEDLITKGRDLERKVLADAVRLFTEHRIFVCGKRTIIL